MLSRLTILASRKLVRHQISTVLREHFVKLHSFEFKFNMAIPGSCLTWKFTTDDIDKVSDRLMKSSKIVHDAVGAIKKEDLTYDNIIKVLADDECEYSVERSNIDFVQHVFPDKQLRDASVAADKKLSEFEVEMSMHQGVFANLVAFHEMKAAELKPEALRYVERLIKLGKRNGLHLSTEKQDLIKEIKKKISDLGIDFSKNLNEENTILEFALEDLVGVPEDFVKSLDKTDDGNYKVSLKYPHYFPCMKKARNPETRKKLEIAFNSRCMKENTPILEELVKLRHDKSQLLGFPTHAAFVLDMRMAKTAEAVAKFLSELKEKLRPLQKEEVNLFLEYKKQECADHGYTDDGKLNVWDLRYYMNMVEEKKYSVDQNALKEYFPMDVVTRGLLDIYQELLGLKFEPVKTDDLWHEDVALYSVADAETQTIIGYFYLDLYPREGKYGHAACFPLQPGCVGKDGTRQISVVALVCNFTKPTEDQPSLLTHDEVETFFHEFGHAMHQICAEANFPIFSGTNVERDFVEAPSQMLENWCWEKESLNKMSTHYKDSTPIPDEMLEKLMNSRMANAGVFNLRQILLGTFDQTIHTREQADTAAIFKELSQDIVGIEPSPNTNMPAAFGHLGGGYDAQYYGYLWSEVFSMDMFQSRFKKEGIMSRGVGLDYRRFILRPGGSLDADVMLKNFLGRDPIQEPFLQSKGLKS